MFGLTLPRRASILTAGALLLIGLLLLGLYLLSPHATLRVTSGLPGTTGQRFISAFISVATADHPRVRFALVPVANLAESAKAMESGAVDLALVRSDVSPPVNGQTAAILRRDVVAFIVPGNSSIKDPTNLPGKTVAIPTGVNQDYNSQALDTILSYFNIAPDKVKRLFLPAAEIGAAIHHKRAEAALAVGPIGPGDPVDVVASIARATKQTPEILAIDQADAIVKRFPSFESIDVPAGAFKGRPEVPDDTVTCLAITYRMVVPERMLNVVAGLIGMSILKTKEKLMKTLPVVTQIEAPDTDSTSPVLPVHPGVAAYLTSGDQSFFDSLQQYLYIVGIPLSILGSLGAVVFGRVTQKKALVDQQQVYRLLVLAEAARTADSTELAKLEEELDAIVAACVNKVAEGASDASQLPISALAIDHTRRSIDRRRRQLDISAAA
jgi:TRAP-type uncharacterized transport system substrate-binding protein